MYLFLIFFTQNLLNDKQNENIKLHLQLIIIKLKSIHLFLKNKIKEPIIIHTLKIKLYVIIGYYFFQIKYNCILDFYFGKKNIIA